MAKTKQQISYNYGIPEYHKITLLKAIEQLIDSLNNQIVNISEDL